MWDRVRRATEEARREDEADRKRWEEEFKQWIGSVSAPYLGWALQALEIDTLEGLTLRQAQAAFHKVAKRCHPDVTGQAASAEQFKDINEAYECDQAASSKLGGCCMRAHSVFSSLAKVATPKEQEIER